MSYGIPSKLMRMIADLYEGFECAVIDENETSDWFKIKTEVKQRCVMSGFVFLPAIDWVRYEKDNSRQEKRDRLQLYNRTEDLDFADDVALMSSKLSDLREKTGRLTEKAAGVQLELNAGKCQTFRTQHAKRSERIVVNVVQVVPWNYRR